MSQLNIFFLFTSDPGPCLLKLYQKIFREFHRKSTMKNRSLSRKRAKTICYSCLRDCDYAPAEDSAVAVEKPWGWVRSCVHAQCVDARCCCAWTFANKKDTVLVCLGAFDGCELVDWFRSRTIFRKKDTSVSCLKHEKNLSILS